MASGLELHCLLNFSKKKVKILSALDCLLVHQLINKSFSQRISQVSTWNDEFYIGRVHNHVSYINGLSALVLDLVNFSLWQHLNVFSASLACSFTERMHAAFNYNHGIVHCQETCNKMTKTMQTIWLWCWLITHSFLKIHGIFWYRMNIYYLICDYISYATCIIFTLE